MSIKMVSNLSGRMEDKRLSRKTNNDLTYIRNVRERVIEQGNRGSSTLFDSWATRFDDANIKRAKRVVRNLDEVYHEGRTLHRVNPLRLDRTSERMLEYMGVNPYTRKDLIDQSLDLPHTDKLSIGKKRLKSNFSYREVTTGVSTANIKTTTIFSDGKDYIPVDDRRLILNSWDRMLNEVNKKDV